MILLASITYFCTRFSHQSTILYQYRRMRCTRVAALCTFCLQTSRLLLTRPTTRLFSQTKETEDYFLAQVEQTVRSVFAEIPQDTDILSLPPTKRESFGTAKHLHKRIHALRRNNDCARCWLQRKHCICRQCTPIDSTVAEIDKIFLVMHHKEVGMAVDTAKIILAALPQQTTLVVAGIDRKFQSSMQEMERELQTSACLVLFPTENAKEYQEYCANVQTSSRRRTLFVIDGTWEQARKIYHRYLANSSAQGVCLSPQSLETIARTGEGRQLRRHPEKWREISTLEATRLMLREIDEGFPANELARYQRIADAATRIQLGPPRTM